MNFFKRWIVKHEAEKFADNAIKESTMSPQLKAWLIGAANAAISGTTAGAIGDGLGLSTKKAILLAVGSAGMSFIKWWKQHPIPEPDPQPKPAPTPIKEK